MTSWLLVLVAYITGSIPTSFLVGKWVHGIDLRQHGSGNLGATNAFRVLGWKAASPVFALDVAKGWLPTFWFPLWDGRPAGWALAYGAAAVAGHMCSVFVGFRGGKGVATSGGVFLALTPLAVLITLSVWIVMVVGTGYVSLASIAAAIMLPTLIAVMYGVEPVTLLAVMLAVIVLIGHRNNMRRLWRGEEHRFRRNKAGAPP